MPTPNVFTACEKVIFDSKGLPSLINLFQRMDVQLTDIPFPSDAVAPQKWSLFCQWQLKPDEVDRDFVQRVKMILPNGTVFAEAATSFRLTAGPDLQVRNHTEIGGLPIGEQGLIRISVWLDGDEANVYDCSIYIQHTPKPELPS